MNELLQGRDLNQNSSRWIDVTHRDRATGTQVYAASLADFALRLYRSGVPIRYR
jgi:hypothetical protein